MDNATLDKKIEDIVDRLGDLDVEIITPVYSEADEDSRLRSSMWVLGQKICDIRNELTKLRHELI